jgi:hypothetical protein
MMMTQFSPRTRARIEVIGFALLVAAIWLLVPITSTTH